MKYYKLGNSNNKTNYEIISELNNIKYLLSKNTTSIYASFFSAYAANVISKCKSINIIVQFLIFFAILLFSKYVLNYAKKITIYIFTRINKESNEQKEIEAYYVFYMEILNNLVQATSLKNRYCELQQGKNKKELQYIYLQQAYFYYALANKELDEKVFVRRTIQREANIDYIGRNNLKHILVDAIENVDYLQKEILNVNNIHNNALKNCLINKLNQL